MPCPQPKASAATPGPSNSPASRDAARHALFEVSDAVEYLKDSHEAFEALEELVTPVGINDADRLEVGRSRLGCLLRVLNRDMREQIDSTMRLIGAARSA